MRDKLSVCNPEMVPFSSYSERWNLVLVFIFFGSVARLCCLTVLGPKDGGNG